MKMKLELLFTFQRSRKLAMRLKVTKTEGECRGLLENNSSFPAGRPGQSLTHPLPHSRKANKSPVQHSFTVLGVMNCLGRSELCCSCWNRVKIFMWPLSKEYGGEESTLRWSVCVAFPRRIIIHPTVNLTQFIASNHSFEASQPMQGRSGPYYPRIYFFDADAQKNRAQETYSLLLHTIPEGTESVCSCDEPPARLPRKWIHTSVTAPISEPRLWPNIRIRMSSSGELI